jgi:hypothetical protein
LSFVLGIVLKLLNQSDDEEDDPRARDHEDASRAGLEDGYEPPRPDTFALDSAMADAADATLSPPTREARKAVEDRFHRRPIVVHYPSDVAGQPLRSDRSKTTEQVYKSTLDSSADENPYAPFKSKMDWEVGKWAKLRGSGSTAFTDLLQVEGVCTRSFQFCS